MSKRCANSASVYSLSTAANATFALNTGLRFRRGRLLILPPARSHPGCLQARNLLIPLSKFPEPPIFEKQAQCSLEFFLIWALGSHCGFSKLYLKCTEMQPSPYQTSFWENR